MNGGSDTGNSLYFPINGAWDGTSIYTVSDGSNPSVSVTVGQFAHLFADGSTTPTFIARVTVVQNAVNGTITLSTTAAMGSPPGALGSGMTLRVGGAWKGPNGTTIFPFGSGANLTVNSLVTDAAGDPVRVNFKNNATYTVSVAIAHSVVGPITFQGYTTTAGDGGQFILSGGTSGASYTVLSFGISLLTLRDAILRNNGATGSAAGVTITAARTLFERVSINGMLGENLKTSSGPIDLVEVEIYGGNGSNTASLGALHTAAASALPVRAVRCKIHHNVGSNVQGVLAASGIYLEDCIVADNGKGGVETGGTCEICIRGGAIRNNVATGVLVSNVNSRAFIEDTAIESNGTFGVSVTGSPIMVRLSNVSFFANPSGQTNGAVDATGSITASASTFNDGTNGDFGAATGDVKGKGRGAYPQVSGSYSKTTTGYPDVGVQHQDAGGMLIHPGMTGGFNG